MVALITGVLDILFDFMTKIWMPAKHASADKKIPASAAAVYYEASSRTIKPQRRVQMRICAK